LAGKQCISVHHVGRFVCASAFVLLRSSRRTSTTTAVVSAAHRVLLFFRLGNKMYLVKHVFKLYFRLKSIVIVFLWSDVDGVSRYSWGRRAALRVWPKKSLRNCARCIPGKVETITKYYNIILSSSKSRANS